jgi:dihydrofolate reductase
MIGIIAAVSLNGVIGVDGKLPFDYPEDMKHFRKTTACSNIIMGRKTFESIGKPLPKRRNIVISSKKIEVEGIETFPSIKAVADAGVFKDLMRFKDADGIGTTVITPNTWFIGGASIYEEGMEHADTILLTCTPDIVKNSNAVKFPFINPLLFKISSTEPLDEAMWKTGTSKLQLVKYSRNI